MVESKGTFRGYEYLITFDIDFGFRCGYVVIPEGHPYYKKFYEDIDNVRCHGGLTFSGFSTLLGYQDKFMIGFDCNHGEMPDFESIKKYNGQISNYLESMKNRPHLTPCMSLDDCIEDCKNIICAAINAENAVK